MAQGPQQPKPRKMKKADFGFIIILFLMLLGIFLYFSRNANQTELLTPDEFSTLLSDNKITEVYVTPVGGANENLWYFYGTFLDRNNEPVRFELYATNTVLEKVEAIANPQFVFEYVPLRTFDWWSFIISIIVPLLLLGGLIIFFVRSAGQGGNNKAFEFGKSRARLNRASTTTFKDVAGADEEKQEMEEVIDFLKFPKKYFDIGARIPKGILLVGPPGTGKTLLARAVAGEAKVPFYSISGSDFVEMFVGVGASRVRDMFKIAKQTAPCIVFIDEIDAVGRQRGAGLGGGHDEREQTLNQLLVELDGFSENSGIIVMAATNRPDVLDPALLRPGRFDRQITMSNPDVKGRVAILQVHSRNKRVSPKVNFEDVAKRTPGFSGADLENLLNEAALLAARENRKEIKIYDIDEAIDRVLMGPAKRSKKYSEREKMIVSYHEAGHAVLGVKLDNAEIVQKVTIVPRGQAGGYSMMTPEEERFLHTKQSLLDTITGLLGGRIAEELMTNDITTGGHNDFQKATLIARSMVTEYGMSELGPIQYERGSQNVFLGRDYMTDKNFSDQVALEIDHAVRQIINECYETGKRVLTENKDSLIAIAEHLKEIETLTKEDIYEIIDTGKLGWWEKKKAKMEAERIAKEKEAELQEIYEKQLKAMEDAKKKTEDSVMQESVDEASNQEVSTEEKNEEPQKSLDEESNKK